MGLFSRRPKQISSALIEEFSKNWQALSNCLEGENCQKRWSDLNRMIREYMNSPLKVTVREETFRTINSVLKIQRDSCTQWNVRLTRTDVDSMYSAVHGLINVETDPIKKLLQNINMTMFTGGCPVQNIEPIRAALNAVNSSYAMYENGIAQAEKRRLVAVLSNIRKQIAIVDANGVQALAAQLRELNNAMVDASMTDDSIRTIDVLNATVANIKTFMKEVDNYVLTIDAECEKIRAVIQAKQARMQELMQEGARAKETNNALLYGQLKNKFNAFAKKIQSETDLLNRYNHKILRIQAIQGAVENAEALGSLSKITKACFKKAKLNDLLEENYQKIMTSLDVDLADDPNAGFDDIDAAVETAFDNGVFATIQENAAADAFDMGVQQTETANKNQTV